MNESEAMLCVMLQSAFIDVLIYHGLFSEVASSIVITDTGFDLTLNDTPRGYAVRAACGVLEPGRYGVSVKQYADEWRDEHVE